MKMDIPSLRPETRYGMPSADHLLFNRGFIVGYSYLYRQPAWTLQLINDDSEAVIEKRRNNFRVDHRIPEMFRADLNDFRGSGYDRGHMVSSADQRSQKVLNSETFLLSNMSVQNPRFNRGKWRELEESIRDAAALDHILEIYVLSGMLFDVSQPLILVGKGKSQLVVPHYYFKSVLTEDVAGRLTLRTFMLPNRECSEPLKKYLVPTELVESIAGLQMWDRLVSDEFIQMKKDKGSW